MAISQAYYQQQYDQQRQYEQMIANMTAQSRQANTAVSMANQGYLSNLLSNISGYMKDAPGTFDPQFDHFAVGTQIKDLNDHYARAVSRYDEGSGYSSRMGLSDGANDRSNLLSFFQPAMDRLVRDYQAGYESYKQPIQTNQSQIPQLSQQYASFRQGTNEGIQGILSAINDISRRGTEMYNRGVAREGELRSQRVNERSQYYANQASRQAMMTANRAEKRQAGAISRQRGALTRATNQGYLSSQLTR
jgi:hypothetical protein